MEIIKMLRKWLKEWKEVSENKPVEFEGRGWNVYDHSVKNIQNAVRDIVQDNEEAMEALTEAEKAQVKQILSYVD